MYDGHILYDSLLNNNILVSEAIYCTGISTVAS